MKKIVLFFIVFCYFITANAGNDGILAKISQAGKQRTSIESPFVQSRTTAAKVKTSLEGTLYFKNPGQLAMIYSRPTTERVILNGNSLHITTNGKKANYDLGKNPTMRKLANFLCQAMTGQVENIATANNANYSISDDGKNYVITLTAKKTAVQGFSKITLCYRKSDCVLVKMETIEFNKMVNNYELKSVKTNGSISKSIFEKQ